MDLPVIVVTGETDEVLEANLMEEGAGEGLFYCSVRRMVAVTRAKNKRGSSGFRM